MELSPRWSLDASRVCLDMLVNPYGERTHAARSPRSEQGMVELLVDVTGPCGDSRQFYAVNDVMVSDFCLPAFYLPAGARAAPATPSRTR